MLLATWQKIHTTSISCCQQPVIAPQHDNRSVNLWPCCSQHAERYVLPCCWQHHTGLAEPLPCCWQHDDRWLCLVPSSNMPSDPRMNYHVATSMIIVLWIYYRVASNMLIDRLISYHAASVMVIDLQICFHVGSSMVIDPRINWHVAGNMVIDLATYHHVASRSADLLPRC